MTKIPCPACAEIIQSGAKICRYCHLDLTAIHPIQDAPDENEIVIFSGHPAPIYSFWQVVITVFTFGLAYSIYKAKSLSVHYEITNQRIKIEYGLAIKTRNYVELYNIEHFSFWSTWGMRIAGFQAMELRTFERAGQRVCIYGITGLEELADQLRECSFRERQRRNITSFIRPI